MLPPARPVRISRPLPQAPEEFGSELRRRLGLLRREIEALQRRAAELDGESRADYLDLAEAILRNADRLERKVETYLAAPSGEWERFRAGAEENWRELKLTLVRVATSLRQRYPELDAAAGRTPGGRPAAPRAGR